jgi:hypothetical protein
MHIVRNQQPTRSSCASGVENNGQCDNGGFKLDTAAVAAKAGVERNEVRWVRSVLSELQLQVPECGLAGAGSGLLLTSMVISRGK